ncbi:alpha-amylase, partial [Sarracenia purpurea var. burkii]
VSRVGGQHLLFIACRSNAPPLIDELLTFELQELPSLLVFSTNGPPIMSGKCGADSNNTFTDFLDEEGNLSRRSGVLELGDGELTEATKALFEVRSRQQIINKGGDELPKELARPQAKQQEYVTTIMHDRGLAIVELEAARSLFSQKLQEFLEEKFKLESKLIPAKLDAVELAAQVGKLAEIAFQQAAAHILEDA